MSEVGAHDAALRPDELDGIGDGLRSLRNPWGKNPT